MGWAYCQQGLKWHLATGSFINFFHDPWIGPKILIRNLIHGPLLRHEYTLPLAHFRQQGNWNFSSLSFNLPQSIISLIHNIHFSVYNRSHDRISWGLTSSGKFTVKSCFMELLANTEQKASAGTSTNLSWIWKLHLPQKINQFLWILAHNRLPTSKYLEHIGVLHSSLCRNCNSTEIESASHIFLKCDRVADLWSSLGISQQINMLADTSPSSTNWLHDLIWILPKLYIYRIPSKVFLAFCMWSIWTARNKLIFEETTINLTIHNMAHMAQEFWFLAGDVFRDYYGNWILGFASSSYSANTLEAEAKAVFQGLSIGQEHAISSIQINIDSKELVAQLGCSPTNNFPLLCDCRCLLQRMGSPDICHIYREQNKLADALVSTITTTTFMHNSPATVMLFWESPSSLMDILCADQRGDLTARRVKYSPIDQDVHNISVADVVHIPTSLARATSASSSVVAMPHLLSL
ncbi:hypothetical protein CQW23_25632 [Capsicum baccatum]|uniref:RNase H type-1 domain-containing protein n=1 Tax=Capsicum baccatum TaxID=33114 RepID=A0A2G2VLJ6_CAPBA|nr:hypothetical protein CQW23_25632 [Capsicum baccatum]